MDVAQLNSSVVEYNHVRLSLIIGKLLLITLPNMLKHLSMRMFNWSSFLRGVPLSKYPSGASPIYT